jgi:hypothetical protein
MGSTDEHVREGIRVPLDKVRGNGFERYEASVCGHHGMEAVRIPLDTCGVHAHSDRRAQLPITDEHVPDGVGVPWTRFVAPDWKATKRPSAEIAGM